MGDVPAMRAKLQEDLLENHRREYAQVLETSKALEGKAQLSITVGAVFLAAVFAFSKDLALVAVTDKVLLALAIVVLVLAVVLSLQVFSLTALIAPPLGAFMEQRTKDVLRQQDSRLEELIDQLLVAQSKQWLEAIESAQAANERKADMVWRSQIALVCGVGITSLLTIIRVI